MNRLTLQDIEQILHNRIKDDQYKTLKDLPKPDSFKDIDKATKRIVQAIKNNETINLVGDYDVDGVTSTALMVDFFKYLNVELNYIIPNRFEHGYGLSPIILEQIEEGLILTVDNGISANQAADISKQRGLDLIITDHHTVGDSLPDAYAIVNPKQSDCTFPFKDICGAQVAWYLCASIKKELNIDFNLMHLLDFVALAIVADIMPMKSLNQTMVKAGLKVLQTTQRSAFVALRERFALKNINEEDIGFKIAPLINCAGRMADPSIALEFLLSNNSHEANMQLDYLVELNEERKQEQLKIFNEAKAQVNENDKVIVVSSSSWNEGIVGIVAAKLCEKYKKPALVFSVEGNRAKASCRSTSNTNLYELISACSEVLNGFGGHKQAAGLSIDTNKIEIFKSMLNNTIDSLPVLEDSTVNSIGSITIAQANHNLYNMIESYRPFGITNPYPIFSFLDFDVINVSKMGRNKEFTKLIVSDGSLTSEVVIFTDFDDVSVGSKINFTATISKNEFRGTVNFNLMFKELL